MTLETALEGFKNLYEGTERTINPEMVQIAIDAIDYKIKTKGMTILTEEEPDNTFE